MLRIGKVRIARNRVGFRQSSMRLLNLVNVFLKIYIRRKKAADHDYIVEARHQKILIDTQVSEQRLHKVMNDVVLGDLKIEEQKRNLGLNNAWITPEEDARARAGANPNRRRKP